MDKRKQKKETYNTDIIKALIEKYSVGKDYIQKSIRGERTGLLPIKIKEDYEKAAREAKKVVKQKINDL